MFKFTEHRKNYDGGFTRMAVTMFVRQARDFQERMALRRLVIFSLPP